MKEVAQDYDAFLSFSSADRRRVRRIQWFLQRWKDRTSGRRLTVCLDETDIRGGGIDRELERAIKQARTLIICASPTALESRWVLREVEHFKKHNNSEHIAAAVVRGQGDAAEWGRRLVPGSEIRVHDMRSGWWLVWLGLGVELELVRLLAFVANVDIRTLRNWHARRTLRQLSLALIAVLIPLWLVLILPMDRWERLNLRLGNEPLNVIAAEVQDQKLWIASYFRGARPQGFANYIRVVADVESPTPKVSHNEYAPRRHLVPLNRIPYNLRPQIPTPNIKAHSTRAAVGIPLGGEVSPGRWVIIQPLAPTEEELDSARDQSADAGTPIPSVMGSLVVTVDGETRVETVVADLNPVWDEIDSSGLPSSPSRGIAVAWAPDGELWLGSAGRDAAEVGGLWRRARDKPEFERVPDFFSVNSIELRLEGSSVDAITVAERHLERWVGIRIESRPSRVVWRRHDEIGWHAATAPPFGSRSEIELAGLRLGKQLVRVDESVFQLERVPLWRYVAASW